MVRRLGPDQRKIDAMAQALIVTANAFKLGLTAQVSFPVFNDDPHPAFANLTTSLKIVDQMHSMLEYFMDELATTNDPRSLTASCLTPWC